MSFFPGKDPAAGDKFQCDAIKALIVPRTADLGDGFTVRRALPSAQSRMVGPFVFFDHFGPTVFKSGNGLDVRPHPHIGLATVTYLFDGEIMHRDSLGTAVPIRPGAVNWMTAGHGIVHSERTATERRAKGDSLHGLQMWVALPAAQEEMAPDFAHHAVDAVPDGARQRQDRARRRRLGLWRALAGRDHLGRRCSPTSHLKAGSTLPLDADHEERAIYVLDGEIDIAGDKFGGDRLLVFKPGDAHHHPRADRRAFHDLRRRADGWARATSGGISSRRARTASSRPRPNGPPATSRRCRATRSSSSRCRRSDSDRLDRPETNRCRRSSRRTP